MKGREIKELKEIQKLLREIHDAIQGADMFQLWMIKNILQYLIEEIEREMRRRELASLLGIDIIDSERGP